MRKNADAESPAHTSSAGSVQSAASWSQPIEDLLKALQTGPNGLTGDESHGPPLAHRLNPSTVADLAARAGFQSVEAIRLEHMDLYRLTP